MSLVVLMVGCGGATGNGAVDVGFSIKVASANFANTIGVLTPSTGNTYCQVVVTVDNRTAAKAVATIPALFSLITTSGLSVMANGALGEMGARPCKADVSVVAVGSTSCGLAFEVAKGDAPRTLSYKDEVITPRARPGRTRPAPAPRRRAACSPTARATSFSSSGGARASLAPPVGRSAEPDSGGRWRSCRAEPG